MKNPFWLSVSIILLAGISHVAAASSLPVTVRIETADDTLISSDVYVTSAGCSIKDTDGIKHTLDGYKALCAVKTAAALAGLDLTVQDSSYGLYLTAIGDNAASSTDYWSFFVNYTAASVGLADYELTSGDAVVISLGGYPNNALEVNLNDTQVLVDHKLIARVKANGEAVEGATVYFGNVAKTTDHYGKASYRPKKTTSNLAVYAEHTGDTRSAYTMVRVLKAYEHPTVVTAADRQAMITAAVAYLTARVDADGLITSSQSVADWSALALVQAGATVPAELQAAVESYDPTTEDTYATTELARHILVLVALGDDPYATNGVDYVARLLAMKSDGQFGSAAYVNDDIYAGLALLAAGVATDDINVTKAVTAAKDSVNADGGVSYGVDLTTSDNDTTGVFVQLLSAVGDDSKVYRRAVNYLLDHQNLDGGWGYDDTYGSNSSSTATVLQALEGAGYTLNKVQRNHRSGLNFLASLQNDAGGFEYDVDGSYSYKTINSAYAISALAQAWLGMIN